MRDGNFLRSMPPSGIDLDGGTLLDAFQLALLFDIRQGDGTVALSQQLEIRAASVFDADLAVHVSRDLSHDDVPLPEPSQ